MDRTERFAARWLAFLALPAVLGLAGCEPSKIVVEDMHAGAWMAIENASFEFYEEHDGVVSTPQSVCTDNDKSEWGTCDPDAYETVYRHGILFQMGYSVTFPDEHTGELHLGETETSKGHPLGDDGPSGPATGGAMLLESAAVDRTEDTSFGGIYIKHDKGDAWLLPGVRDSVSFDWLDVRETGSKCVIDPLRAYQMLVNPDMDIDTECPDPTTLSGTDYYCARNRSVHADVEARWLVTYWSGADFYQMSAGETDEKEIVKPDETTVAPSHGDSHVSYKFKLPKKVVVDRWLLGCHEEQYTGVSEIRILYHEDSVFHLGYPHLPMNGGIGR